MDIQKQKAALQKWSVQVKLKQKEMQTAELEFGMRDFFMTLSDPDAF